MPPPPGRGSAARCGGSPTRARCRSRRSTRARTISPSSSISAALASPVLIRKLQCLSETTASPWRSPRQPAASISCQACWPGGFLKVLPPVATCSGWVASRSALIAIMRARIASCVARHAAQHRAGRDPAFGQRANGGSRSPARRRAARAARRPDRARSTRSTTVGGLAAEGAGVHAHRAAHRAGDADEELEPGQARPLRGDRDHAIGRAGADREAVAVDLDLGERPRQPDHDAVEPAVADQEVGGDADRHHRQPARLGLEERGQVVERRPAGRSPRPGRRRAARCAARAAPACAGVPRTGGRSAARSLKPRSPRGWRAAGPAGHWPRR